MLVASAVSGFLLAYINIPKSFTIVYNTVAVKNSNVLQTSERVRTE